MEPSATATAPRRQRRTGLVAGAALLVVIGVAGAAYMQRQASFNEPASIPPGPKSEVQGSATPLAELPKETPPLDAQVWEAIRSSTNPADFEAYLRIFPNGAVADLARERLRALAPAPQPSVSTTGPSSAAPAPVPQEQAIATESAPPPVPAPQPSASMDAPATPAPTPVPRQKAIATRSTPPSVPAPQPPARTTGPTSPAPAPTPQQKAIASRTALPSVPAPQPRDPTNAPTTTTPTDGPQQQAGAAVSTSAGAPTVGSQQQAMIAPDASKSATSPALPGAPYDGEWKGFSLGTSPTCSRGPCRENVEVTVAKNAVSGELKGNLGNANLSGTIANDGSFSGKLGDARISGKFDADRFQGVISGSLTLSGGTSSAALFLERVK